MQQYALDWDRLMIYRLEDDVLVNGMPTEGRRDDLDSTSGEAGEREVEFITNWPAEMPTSTSRGLRRLAVDVGMTRHAVPALRCEVVGDSRR